jgi:hypothetical protein
MFYLTKHIYAQVNRPFEILCMYTSVILIKASSRCNLQYIKPYHASFREIEINGYIRTINKFVLYIIIHVGGRGEARARM